MTHVHCTLYQVLGHLGANDDACRRAIRARRDDLSGAPAPVRAAAAFVLQEECGAGTGGATSTGLLHLGQGWFEIQADCRPFLGKSATCHFDFVLNLKSFTRIVLNLSRKGHKKLYTCCFTLRNCSITWGVSPLSTTCHVKVEGRILTKKQTCPNPGHAAEFAG